MEGYHIDKKVVPYYVGSTEMIEEVVFNASPYNYFEVAGLLERARREHYLRAQEEIMDAVFPDGLLFDKENREVKKKQEKREYLNLPEELDSLVWFEDRDVVVNYRGKVFRARIFRKFGSWFAGQNSFGRELAYLIGEYVGDKIYMMGRDTKDCLVECFKTGSCGPVSHYGYKPFIGVLSYVRYGEECEFKNSFKDGWYRRDESNIVGIDCSCCPMYKGYEYMNGKEFVKCNITRFLPKEI